MCTCTTFLKQEKATIQVQYTQRYQITEVLSKYISILDSFEERYPMNPPSAHDSKLDLKDTLDTIRE